MDPNAIAQNFRDIVINHYFDFDGRTRRSVFWYFVMAYFVIWIVLAVVQRELGMYGLLTGLFTLALLLPNLGLAARRLHDTGRTAWWLLIGLVPVAGWIVLIYWYSLEGESGANQFGPDPKAPGPGAA